MTRYTHLILTLALIVTVHLGFGQTRNRPLTAQSFTGEIVIQASPTQVWKILTDATRLTEVLGYKYLQGAKKFARVGDRAAVQVWGDDAGFMVVRAEPTKELRFNLDPENGSYICNCRWVLSGAGKATTVKFEERYTESSPQTREELEAQVKDINENLKKLKHIVETQ
ncbi:MAG: hypothetical protein D6681_11810 [Calditrichaeota bacterium]|nr:MAG: hypothetical protein D6681_11810 [Calditrichota bacterium]